MTSKRHEDAKRDRAVEDSFPASDPPANSGIVGPRVSQPDERDEKVRPKTTPADERPRTGSAFKSEPSRRR